MPEDKQNTAFDRVQTARHPNRPYSMDLFSALFGDFIELHGDRRYADDAALVCGFARLDGHDVVVLGQQKGRDLNQRRHRNFGMPKPEGYRKALRVMKLAEKFGRPVISFIDTPGAYPGIDAEERGQAEAIAFNLLNMAGLKVPIIVVVLGEGGSGGALAVGVGDRVLMMENAVYSVISPEGCASILWKDAGKAALAADSLRLTASDLKSLKLVDEIIPEPSPWEIQTEENGEGGRGPFDKISENVKDSILKHLNELSKLDHEQLLASRFQKFREMGEWV